VAFPGFLLIPFSFGYDQKSQLAHFVCLVWQHFLIQSIVFSQQGKIAETEKSIAALFGKERVPEVMNDLRAAVQGSSEPEAGWLDLFSSRYRKGIS